MIRTPFCIRIDGNDGSRWVCRGPNRLWKAEKEGGIEAEIANARYGEGFDAGADEATARWLRAIAGTNDETKILQRLISDLFKQIL